MSKLFALLLLVIAWIGGVVTSFGTTAAVVVSLAKLLGWGPAQHYSWLLLIGGPPLAWFAVAVLAFAAAVLGTL